MTSNSTITAKQKITKLICVLLFAEVALLLFVQARTVLYNVGSPNASLRNSCQLYFHQELETPSINGRYFSWLNLKVLKV